MKKYEIEFPDLKENEKSIIESENSIKFKLKNTGNGILSKIMIFLYQSNACSATELSEILSKYYKIPFDRSNIWKYLKYLMNIGLSSSHTSYYANNQNGNGLLKIIREKHKEFLESVPSQFHKKFTNVNYFYVTDYGEKFIPWCAESINLKIHGEKDGRNIKQ